MLFMIFCFCMGPYFFILIFFLGEEKKDPTRIRTDRFRLNGSMWSKCDYSIKSILISSYQCPKRITMTTYGITIKKKRGLDSLLFYRQFGS